MVGTLCSVAECGNRGGHAWPTIKELSAIWKVAIRSDHWEPTVRMCKASLSWAKKPAKYLSAVCYSHFTEDDYITETSYGKFRGKFK